MGAELIKKHKESVHVKSSYVYRRTRLKEVHAESC